MDQVCLTVPSPGCSPLTETRQSLAFEGIRDSIPSDNNDCNNRRRYSTSSLVTSSATLAFNPLVPRLHPIQRQLLSLHGIPSPLVPAKEVPPDASKTHIPRQLPSLFTRLPDPAYVANIADRCRKDLYGARRCIIYLEPRHTTPLYRALLDLFAASADALGPNEAHQYHPHCSMTGYIPIDDQPTLGLTSGSIIGSLVFSLDCLTRTHALPSFTHAGDGGPLPIRLDSIRTRTDYPVHGTHKVELLIEVPDSLREMVHQLSHDFAGSHVHIRPKRIDHLSLAYFNKHVKTSKSITSRDALTMDAMARLYLLQHPDIWDCREWDIALYEQTFNSSDVAVPHRFREIIRWPLPANRTHE